MTVFFRYFVMLLLTLPVCYAQYSLPDEIIFAGRKVPLDKFDVRDRLSKTFNIMVLDRRGFIQNLLDKQPYFIPDAKEIFNQYGVNEDLVYIMPVESEFDPRSYSEAKASGLWQLMPATAKMYGLRVDNFADERNLPDKSTKAAAEHLKMLSKLFSDDPFLIIAAYNNGDSNVRSTLESQKSGDFWETRSNHETEFYLEKVIVYKILLSDPEKYGFTVPVKKKEPQYESCTLNLGSKNLDFSEICEILKISYRQLYKFNPHIKFGSYKSGGYISKYTSLDVIIPKGATEKLISELKKRNFMAGSSEIPSSGTNSGYGTPESIYEIKYNDNIESIAFKYGVDWRDLAEKNNLKIVTLPSGVETAEVSKGQKIRIMR